MKRAALLLLLSGCAFSEGQPYGELSATMSAAYSLLGERDLGDGWQKLASELAVRVDNAVLEVDLVELVGGAGALLAFDPTHPPPGYSLCHNGHCHHESGALIDYDDIQAELIGGGAAPLLSLEGGTIDLLASETLSLGCDRCVLDRGAVSLVRMTTSRLAIGGLVRDGLTPPRFDGEVAFSAELRAAALSAVVDVPLDDDHPSHIALALSLNLSAALLDGVSFDAGDGPVMSTDDEALRAAFDELELVTHIERSE